MRAHVGHSLTAKETAKCKGSSKSGSDSGAWSVLLLLLATLTLCRVQLTDAARQSKFKYFTNIFDCVFNSLLFMIIFTPFLGEKKTTKNKKHFRVINIEPK